MKKVTAFLTASVLLFITILTIHTEANQNLDFKNPQFGYWTDDRKFKSPAGIRANLSDDSLVVLASSELEHGVDTPYHPSKIFKGNSFQPMLVGGGYYQSLSHAITLAALEPAMKNHKVVLMVAPQWFRSKGVLPKAYSARFSESAFLDMIKSDSLSKKTKQYITDRTVALLKADEATQARVKDYEKLYLQEKNNPFLALKYNLYESFLDDKQKQNIITAAFTSGIKHNDSLEFEDIEPNWNAYLVQAAKDGESACSNNEFQISNHYYNYKIKPQLKERKNSSSKSSYSSSPEYEDLTCFLNVCEELNIEPMIILLPMNGRWYDYTNFPKERRDEFYHNVKKITANYSNATVTDFSDEDYTDYFMEDTVHIGWKGWVTVNEVLYKFNNSDKN